MPGRRLHLVTTLALSFGGALGLYWATDGARAFTSEGARRLAIRESPRRLPSAVLQDASGRERTEADFSGAPVVVGFVYTQCGTVCPELSREFAELQTALRERGLGDAESSSVQLLSVSFDPERDTPARLAEYARHFGADPERWTFARIADRPELERWLDVFGVVVIPDGRGGFEHNAAFHVVNPAGALAAVFDLGDTAGVLEWLDAESLDTQPPPRLGERAPLGNRAQLVGGRG